MLPTPDTSHLTFTHIYEPAEDSYLLLDTLSSSTETAFLRTRFAPRTPSPLVVEVGSGSGIVLAFLAANACAIFGRPDILACATDVSKYACVATAKTVSLEAKSRVPQGVFLGAINADLYSPVRMREVDVLVFNPPYVPTPELPTLYGLAQLTGFEAESRYLQLTYAGGPTGMATTDRLLEGLDGVLSKRGVLYLLLCAQNNPEEVAKRLRDGGYVQERERAGVQWKVEKVCSSGKQGGWEVLSILRIQRE